MTEPSHLQTKIALETARDLATLGCAKQTSDRFLTRILAQATLLFLPPVNIE